MDSSIFHKDTSEDFYNRIFVNFMSEVVFVYPHKISIGIPIKWTIRQARQYINYLEFNEINECLSEESIMI